MMKKSLTVVFFLTCILLSHAFAAKVPSLYQVTVPVASQLSDQRELAEQEGFFEVLVRLTGDPEIDKNPVIKSGIRRAEYYVRDFHYSLPTTTSSSYEIQIDYEKKDIIKLLNKAAVPFWSEKRPVTLGWIVVSDDTVKSELINSNIATPIVGLIEQQSKRLGIDLILPLLDVNDMHLVDASTVTNMDLPVLRKASSRYMPDAMLLANIVKSGKQFNSEWHLIMDAKDWTWKLQGANPVALINTAMSQINQALLRQYTVGKSSSKMNWIQLNVMNLTDNSTLSMLVRYLRQLAPVEQIHLAQASDNEAVFYLQIKGSISNFETAAKETGRLVLRNDNNNKILTYQWVH